MKRVEKFIKDVVKWAANEENLQALAIVGSHARGMARDNSDVDLVIVAEDPSQYLIETDWPEAFGNISTIKIEDWGLLQALRTVYRDGLEVEFGICAKEWANVDPVDGGTRKVVVDGMKVLFDPVGILASLETAILSTTKRPTPSIRIATKRLLLEPLSAKWTQDIFREFTDDVTRYMEPRPARDIAETEAFVQESVLGLEKGTDCTLAILTRDGQEFLGCAGLHRPHTKQPELGIWLKKSGHGKNYGLEAIRGLKDWADRNLEYDCLLYPVDRENIPSRKIAESLGGKVALTREKKSLSGRKLNLIIYKIARK
jgi:[ribosomal protein S5]-alanine N-acetyltransferase